MRETGMGVIDDGQTVSIHVSTQFIEFATFPE